MLLTLHHIFGQGIVDDKGEFQIVGQKRLCMNFPIPTNLAERINALHTAQAAFSNHVVIGLKEEEERARLDGAVLARKMSLPYKYDPEFAMSDYAAKGT